MNYSLLNVSLLHCTIRSYLHRLLTSLEADVLRSTGHPGELGDENHPTGMVVQGHQVVHGAVPEQKDKLTKMHPHFCVYVKMKAC